MVIMGSLYASGSVHATHGPARWVVVVMIYLFAVIFSATWAVGFRVYVSEIQPPKTRAGAASLALSANWVSCQRSNSTRLLTKTQLVNYLVALTTPIFLARSSYGIYFLFGGASWLAALVCVFLMPETRGKSLEDIDASFRGNKVHDVDLIALHDIRVDLLASSNGERVGNAQSSSLFI
jgi:hypothetical protein